MRVLVTTMLGDIPMMGNALILCFFLFMIYGILGIQLFKGAFARQGIVFWDSVTLPLQMRFS